MITRKFTCFLLLICFFLLFSSCKNNNYVQENKIEFDKSPKIEFLLKSNDEDKFYVFENFQDNEKNIKYLFYFTKNIKGWTIILTDRYGAEFEGKVFNSLDTTKQRFSFFRQKDSLKNESIKVNFLEQTSIKFKNEHGKEIQPYIPPGIIVSPDPSEEAAPQNPSKTLALYYDFDSLTVNTLQNLLDFAEQDEEKKQIQTYTYELYNKDKVKKVVITYHNLGEWFDIEIL